MNKELTIKIGGEAGQGLVTIGTVLSNLFSRGGWYVFASQDYESRIRGGHNIYQVRIADHPIWAMSERLDVLIALDRETLRLHFSELHDKSVVIYDGEKIQVAPPGGKAKLISLPMDRIARECGDPILANTVAVAATVGLLGYGLGYLEEYLRRVFGKKGDRVLKENIQAAQRGYEEAERICQREGEACPFKLRPLDVSAKILLSGNEGVALGALAAGCKFYSGYPMTPSTNILTYMASKADQFGVVVEQAEDEIAAINMVIGASFAGARVMTATSGGGFDLMTEGLSLAGMTETPIVIVLGQRPGPATGLPTRTEQAELRYAIHASHGEFPRLVLAPGTPEQGFYLTAHAFNQAEKYQIPVIILTDQYLADSYFTLDRPLDPQKITIDRYLLSEDELSRMSDEYRRYAFTSTGISPRAIPGQSRHLVMADSDEHDEFGHIIEDRQTRSRQVAKRMKKEQMMEQDILPPNIYGHLKAKNMIICWGSTWGVAHEAMTRLHDEGKDVAMLHFTQVWPFPSRQVKDVLKDRDELICIENNASGQMASLIREKTGLAVDQKILQADGRPFSVQYLFETIQEVIG
ncbi:MAG: 2-oxoacid:acceptor oxidoreductase subunit alpha [bacterium]|nr:2-oxoacid:acceptor oxidoreductase subunit alpha [bacterium]